MKQPTQPILRDIVLVGGGHTHVGVLRNFAMKKMTGVRLTLICRDTHTPYSACCLATLQVITPTMTFT